MPKKKRDPSPKQHVGNEAPVLLGACLDYPDVESFLADGLAVLRQQDHLHYWYRQQRQQREPAQPIVNRERDNDDSDGDAKQYYVNNLGHQSSAPACQPSPLARRRGSPGQRLAAA
tara:strand:+ start:296 stop:643 length:348 start_codon:yes stop_codon:yes gene_type:complete